jgi:hypothetical protein
VDDGIVIFENGRATIRGGRLDGAELDTSQLRTLPTGYVTAPLRFFPGADMSPENLAHLTLVDRPPSRPAIAASFPWVKARALVFWLIVLVVMIRAL